MTVVPTHRTADLRVQRRAATATISEYLIAAQPASCSPAPPRYIGAWLAGHAVEVLLKIYAKCFGVGVEVLRQRVQAALSYQSR